MKQSNLIRSLRYAGAGVLCAGLLAACGGAPTFNPKLASARAVYQQAETDPAIAAAPTAQVHLHKAGEALAQAEKADDVKDVEHYAYLAEQEAKTALEMAKRKSAEKEAEILSKEKTETVMMAREREIERARAEAEARAREAEARAREAEVALEEARRAREEAEKLKQQLSELQAKQTERGLVLTLGDVLFETGKATLLAGAMNNIDKLARFLTENPERQIIIEGHTDNVGSETYNLELSRNRANSVRNALLDRNVVSTRIRTEGYGESRPVASNESASGRQQNRRVEIVILDAGKAPQ